MSFIDFLFSLLLKILDGITGVPTCPSGLQPYANRCISQRMADYISCLEASGGNKKEIVDEISRAGKNQTSGGISGSGKGPAVAASGSIALDQKTETELVRKFETRWFPGSMSECAKAMDSTPVVDSTARFAIVLACIVDKKVSTISWTFPFSDISKNSQYSQLSALLRNLPNAACDAASARILRMKDEVALGPESEATATSGGNQGVVLLSPPVIEALGGEHIAFTLIHTEFKRTQGQQ
jgi:hypothetical protein